MVAQVFKTSKSSGYAMTLLLFTVLFAAAAGYAGYYYGSRGKSLINTAKPFVPASLGERMLDVPAKQWGSLVTQSYAEFRVSGTVTELKNGKGGPADRQGDGKLITLKNGSNKQTFFVQASSNWQSGKDGKWPFKTISADDVKVGDKIEILMHAPLREGTTPDAFFGYWVVKST